MELYSKQKCNPFQGISVLNKYSTSIELFEIFAPFMLVYENISEDTDYASAISISPGGINEQYMSFNHAVLEFNKRSPHRHNFFELMYVLEGTIFQTIENETRQYNSGDCCILNKNVSHRENLRGNYKVVFLMLTEEFLIHLFSKSTFLYHENFPDNKLYLFHKLFTSSQNSHNYYLKEYIEYRCTQYTTSKEYKTLLRDLIKQIDYEIREQKPGYLNITEGLILRFFSILENPTTYNQKKFSIKSHSEELLLIKIIHILENASGNIGREQLSEILNYSGDYLNRIVKKHTGMSIITLKNSIYLKKAKDLLLSTDKSITEIIDLLGFKNKSYFYRLFIKEYGTSPGNFRDNSL